MSVAVAALVTLMLYTGCTQSEDHTSRTQSGVFSTPLQERRFGRVPPFSLIERSGTQITLADLRGKVWIADFIFTRCPDACPLMSARMAQLQSEFANESNLKLVSISVDPEYDTPAILARYATQFQAHADRWYFLTGEKKAIYRLVRDGFKLAVHDPDDPQASLPPHTPSRLTVLETLRRWVHPHAAWAHTGHDRRQLVIHSDRFVLVDGAGWIRGYYHGTDPEMVTQLIKDAQELLRTGKDA
jgi:protein SCO1